MTVRQDSWTEEDDLALADLTLRQIREGGTQLAAFEEAAQQLGRTSAACGFRWNSVVRKQYETSIQLAKAQRKKRSQEAVVRGSLIPSIRTESETETSVELVAGILRENTYEPRWTPEVRLTSEPDLERIIGSLRTIQQHYSEVENSRTALQEECERLKTQLFELEQEHRAMSEDYRMFVQMMDRARKMTFLNEEQSGQKPRFRMEQNGNLEPCR